MNIACHACGSKSGEKVMCGDCHMATYCDENCQSKHLAAHASICHVDDEIKTKHEFWTIQNLKGPIYDAVESKTLKHKIDQFHGETIPMQLKAEIAHDLFIGNILFQTYLKVALRSSKAAQRIRDKLDLKEGRVGYVSAYTDRQKAQILAVLMQDNSVNLDPDGVVRDYFTMEMKEDLMDRFPKYFKRGNKRDIRGY